MKQNTVATVEPVIFRSYFGYSHETSYANLRLPGTNL
jgi:hypothetical protein